MPPRSIEISSQLSGQTLAVALRGAVPELSWSQAKRLITGRRVQINGTLCLNDARRLHVGEIVTILEESKAPLPTQQQVRLLHVDPHLVVVDKPPGVMTVRRHEEEDFSEQRKGLQPTLEELVQRMLPGAGRAHRGSVLYAVHRLDRDTSGLMVFAMSAAARDKLIDLFSRHEVRRTYLVVGHGLIDAPLTIDTQLVRDRGDGLRGSVSAAQKDARRAVTHVKPIERIGNSYTLAECRLETGRTHQIRIHLAERGHMVCGEKLYTRPATGAPLVADVSGAPRQALHSTELRFTHPYTKKEMHFTSPMADDLAKWLERLRQQVWG